jgi:hypothetical protein
MAHPALVDKSKILSIIIAYQAQFDKNICETDG